MYSAADAAMDDARLVLSGSVLMAQHFLLSAGARSLSLAKIMCLSNGGVESIQNRGVLVGSGRVRVWAHGRRVGECQKLGAACLPVSG